MDPTPAHMSREEFARIGHLLVDWIASYWDRLNAGDPGLPVLSPVLPGDIAGALPDEPPQRGENWDTILKDFERIIVPGLTHWQSPNFFAYFPANASGPAVLGELLSAGLGVQGMLWATSPAATELETRMLDWLAGMIGLPGRFLSTSPSGGGVIQGTASEATLVAMLAARARNTAAPGQRLACYTSTQAHSSVLKAAMIAGIATGEADRIGFRPIGVDEAFAMRPELLERAIREDIDAGRKPIFVCATVGTTSSTAIDPTAHIGRIAREHGLWLHVDAALAGAAAVCPEFRWLLDGVVYADSFCFNPHKWLLTNFDCSLMWTADRDSVVRALSVTPEYLRNAASDDGAVTDYRDWQVPLGRRFRALKLWFVVRHYGVEGLRAHIRGHVGSATHFEELVRSDERFEVVAERTLNLVCFRLRAGTFAEKHPPEDAGTSLDDLNKRLMESLNATGAIYLTHTVLPGVGLVLRLAVGGTHTRSGHVRAAWELIRSEADKLVSSG